MNTLHLSVQDMLKNCNWKMWLCGFHFDSMRVCIDLSYLTFSVTVFGKVSSIKLVTPHNRTDHLMWVMTGPPYAEHGLFRTVIVVISWLDHCTGYTESSFFMVVRFSIILLLQPLVVVGLRYVLAKLLLCFCSVVKCESFIQSQVINTSDTYCHQSFTNQISEFNDFMIISIKLEYREYCCREENDIVICQQQAQVNS